MVLSLLKCFSDKLNLMCVSLSDCSICPIQIAASKLKLDLACDSVSFLVEIEADKLVDAWFENHLEKNLTIQPPK